MPAILGEPWRTAATVAARDFYRHLIPEIETSPTDDLHLVLLMKDILRTLAVIAALHRFAPLDGG